MEKRPIISVIIPVYNSKPYLKECINSLLKQSFNDIEILIIDDGSTDSSWELIQTLSSRHENIHAFKQTRKGQGAARNKGLSHAQGEYISFVDSDDMLPNDAYQGMYTLATKYDSDLVTGIKKSLDKKRRWLPGRKLSWITVAEHEEFFTHTRPNIQLDDLPKLLVDISVCNKLIRHKLLKKHDFCFSESSASEDINFMARLYMLAKSITIIPKVVYHSCSRHSSGTNRIQPDFFEDRVTIIENLESVFQAAGYSALYHILVLSELRKLVKDRLTRVIELSSYDEQLIIFQTIRRLLNKITCEDISSNKLSLLPLTQARLIMLYHGDFDALIAFTTQPEKKIFRPLLGIPTEEHLYLPLKEYYLEESQKESFAQYINHLTIRTLAYSRRILSVHNYLTKRNLAMLYYLLLQPYFYLARRKKVKNNIWLLDERLSNSAEDNSYVFFQYIKTKHPAVFVYYIIDKNSPDIARLSSFSSSVVFQYSFKHAFLIGKASILLSTDRFTSLAFPFIRFPRLLQNTHNVFLQHGVAGNKTITYTKKNDPYFSQVIVSNDIERLFFTKEYGFSKNEVTVTGIARFDNLSPHPNQHKHKTILIAPTWRNWLRTSQRIASSKYLYFWNQLMTSPDLDAILIKNNVKLFFRPHFNMLPFIKDFQTNSNSIRILTEKNLFLQDYIKKCDLLITDYSSVMYDFFFQQKPAICYMFDRKQWESQPPGPPHISYEQDLPVDIATTSEGILHHLSWYLGNDCEMTEENQRKSIQFFSYRDNNNCERIYRSIVDLSSANI
ncbi:MAG: CDP-glycerol glycerophosphotransferase family protein [Desulfocapsa sp.]|nr:CDP-glycerol glycerophosphotransferase family protein [Desulfocapsa sp.]